MTPYVSCSAINRQILCVCVCVGLSISLCKTGFFGLYVTFSHPSHRSVIDKDGSKVIDEMVSDVCWNNIVLRESKTKKKQCISNEVQFLRRILLLLFVHLSIHCSFLILTSIMWSYWMDEFCWEKMNTQTD